MAEQAYAADLKSVTDISVRVQISPGACKSDRKEVRTMLKIKGKINTAICYASVIEAEAIEQIRRMCDYEFTEGSRIRIMPDVHAGKGCTI